MIFSKISTKPSGKQRLNEIPMTDSTTSELGLVRTEYFTIDRLVLESGEVIAPVMLAYETYGRLNAERSNAVLICHALTGDAHVAGINAATGKDGWWDSMVGPGKAFDTDELFVVCSNVLGGCQGSTGPLSPNPATGEPYGLDFPIITIGDMVSAQARLIEYLGIEKLLGVAGGSMGGMQALAWAAKFPHKINSIIAIATTAKHSPQQQRYESQNFIKPAQPPLSKTRMLPSPGNPRGIM
ncbi:homoserine O-acetyltransferase [Dehalogenimonas formicexedens]|uniref:Homoserine O-acetyltransferase n=1 Tax=Dehalogenimonas formicexedens TaxID=1839801 RepID=A0A1P8F660_9CHLR|nr:homoserine O-acetyltransferase [Dehalogenimonas formicexedens]